MAGALVGTNVLQTVVSMGLRALRERVVLATIVNRDYEKEITGAKRNATVNISVPAAIAARDVVPDVVPPSLSAVTPTSIPITLSQWKEAPFAMDDKGLVQIERNIIPQQMSEAIKTIANTIDAYLWTFTTGFYGFAGAPGVTPFATDLAEYLDARQQGEAQLMDSDPRYVILDTLAEANALGTNAVQNASWRGGNGENFREGVIGRVLGANWAASQNVPRHLAGTWTNAGTTTGTNAAGQGVVNLTGGTGSILVGNIVTFAGDTQTYVVTAATGTAPTTQITVAPNLVTAKSSSEVVTVKASHRMNVLIHRDAIGFAMAPLVDDVRIEGIAVAQAVAVDEKSGLSLRLEITRQHRQYQWSFDALYGAALVRREFGVRIAG